MLLVMTESKPRMESHQDQDPEMKHVLLDGGKGKAVFCRGKDWAELCSWSTVVQKMAVTSENGLEIPPKRL